MELLHPANTLPAYCERGKERGSRVGERERERERRGKEQKLAFSWLKINMHGVDSETFILPA